MSNDVAVIEAGGAVASTVTQGVIAIAVKVAEAASKNPVALAAVVTTGVTIVGCFTVYQTVKKASTITWGKFTFTGKP